MATLTFQSEYGVDNLNDIDLGVGRFDISEYTNQVYNSPVGVGAMEGTATATLNRTRHDVHAGTPMTIVASFAVNELGKFHFEPIEASKINSTDRLLGQPTSLMTTNASTSATSTNEAVTATVGNAVPMQNDNWNTQYAPVVKNLTGVTTYVNGTDYSFDPVHGTVTALVGGAIGGGVAGGTQGITVTYSYFLPLQVLTYGGYASVRTFRIYWCHLRPQDNLWEVLEGYKCIPSLNWVKSYIQNAHNKFAMEFDFIADITRVIGDRIAQYRKQTQQPF